MNKFDWWENHVFEQLKQIARENNVLLKCPKKNCKNRVDKLIVFFQEIKEIPIPIKIQFNTELAHWIGVCKEHYNEFRLLAFKKNLPFIKKESLKSEFVSEQLKRAKEEIKRLENLLGENNG